MPRLPTDPTRDDLDRWLDARRARVQWWITMLNRGWLVAQLATLVVLTSSFVAFFSGGVGSDLLLPSAWGLSVVAAGTAAGFTVWYWWLLSWTWRIVGLTPAIVMLGESTMLLPTFV